MEIIASFPVDLVYHWTQTDVCLVNDMRHHSSYLKIGPDLRQATRSEHANVDREQHAQRVQLHEVRRHHGPEECRVAADTRGFEASQHQHQHTQGHCFRKHPLPSHTQEESRSNSPGVVKDEPNDENICEARRFRKRRNTCNLVIVLTTLNEHDAALSVCRQWKLLAVVVGDVDGVAEQTPAEQLRS